MRWDILFSDLADTFNSMQSEHSLDDDAEGPSSVASDPLWHALRQAARSRVPVSVWLVSGGERLMTVRSIGETWLQAITVHPPVRGVLLPRLAIEGVRAQATPGVDVHPVRGLSFAEVVRVWARRDEPVELHTATTRWTGRLGRVGESSLELTPDTEGWHTVVSMTAIRAVWSVSSERWD